MKIGEPKYFHNLKDKIRVGDVLVYEDGTEELVGDINIDGGHCNCCDGSRKIVEIKDKEER